VKYVLRDTNAAKAGPPVAKSVDEPAPLKPLVEPAKAPAPPRPVNISQKFAVPIAEEGVDFAVEPSMQVARPPRPAEPAPLRLESVIEIEVDDAVSGQPGSPPLDDEDEQLPDIILLDDGNVPNRKRKKRRK
jgi:hypothetical protein